MAVRRSTTHNATFVGKKIFLIFVFFHNFVRQIKNARKLKFAQFRFKDLSGHSVLALVKRNINNRQNQIFVGEKICLRKLDDSRAQHMSSYAAGPTKGSETTAKILYLRSTSIGVGQTF